MTTHDPDWRTQLGARLVSPEDAVSRIGNGAVVSVAPFMGTPFALCEALVERLKSLRGVQLYHPVSLFPWFESGIGNATFHTWFASIDDRAAVNAGAAEYYIAGHWQAGRPPEGYAEEPDVYLVSVSPPDAHGYCSFGPGVWFSPTMVERAQTVIGEVNETFIRTGGANFVHESKFAAFTEAPHQPRRLNLPRRRQDEVPVVEVICALVAAEVVQDRDTLQVGLGTVSAALAPYLSEKADLGVHSELLTGGIAQLVEDGVVTGKHKGLHAGKVVASALSALPSAERALIDGNPAYELYEFSYVDDARVIMQNNNMVAVNNAIMVDLTGQIAAESIGSSIWAGTGGQTSFAVGSLYAPNGRSVTVLPSTHRLGEGTVSRIVPAFPEATSVTVPRTFADIIVTEHGIARLRGRSLRERVRELIGIAHPDFRAELRQAAARLYGLVV